MQTEYHQEHSDCEILGTEKTTHTAIMPQKSSLFAHACDLYNFYKSHS